MRFTFIVCVALFAGCGKNTTKEMEGLAERACACADNDAACGSKVLSDLVAFTEHNKLTDGDLRTVTEAGAKISNCLVSTGVGGDKVTAALEKMVK